VATAKDDAWTPKVKVRGTLLAASKMERSGRDRSKKVAAVEAGLKQAAENKRRKINLKKAKTEDENSRIFFSSSNICQRFRSNNTTHGSLRTRASATKARLLCFAAPGIQIFIADEQSCSNSLNLRISQVITKSSL